MREETPSKEGSSISDVTPIKDTKNDTWDKYLRAIADLDNLRKRTKREIEDAKFDMKQKVLQEMLPVVDSLERASMHAGSEAEGVQLVLRQFQSAFERLDVTPIDAAGQLFDPKEHEAISQQESDAAPGTIVQVLQRGYQADGRLLRPALVVVAKAKTHG